MFTFSQCINCKHLKLVKLNEDLKHVCDAFPNGIPDEIYDNEIFHENAYPNDNGIRYNAIHGTVDAVIRESFKGTMNITKTYDKSTTGIFKG